MRSLTALLGVIALLPSFAWATEALASTVTDIGTTYLALSECAVRCDATALPFPGGQQLDFPGPQQLDDNDSIDGAIKFAVCDYCSEGYNPGSNGQSRCPSDGKCRPVTWNPNSRLPCGEECVTFELSEVCLPETCYITIPGLEEGCRSDADCPTEQRCGSNRLCELVSSTPCEENEDCQEGTICNTNKRCEPFLGPECKRDRDCRNNQVCTQEGICATLGDPPCEKAADCPLNQICNSEGKCQVPNLPPKECERNSDCPIGSFCSQANLCQNPPEGCRTDQDCDEGEGCNSQGLCQRTQNGPCVADSDCIGDTTCEGNSCPQPPQCATSSDCRQGEVCDVEDTCELTPPCQVDRDCTQGEICNANQACELPHPPTGCRQDSDCPSENICLQGVCQPPEGCRTDSDCARGQRCDIPSRAKRQEARGTCVPLSMSLPPPTSHSSSPSPTSDSRSPSTSNPSSSPPTPNLRSPPTSSSSSPPSTSGSSSPPPTSGSSSPPISSSSSPPPSSTSSPPECTPGTKWAYYKLDSNGDNTESSAPGKLPQNDNSGRPDWASQYFNVQTVLDGQSPTDTGETRIIGVANQCDNDRPINIYNTTHDTGLENTIVQNIGYFHPSKSGTYTFRLQNIDEGAYLWLGDKAKSGFTNSNADATANYVNDDKGTAEFQFPATAGEYVPFRALFANSVVCGQFDLQVTDPDGNTVISIDKEDTDGQFGFACGDNPQAPDFGF